MSTGAWVAGDVAGRDDGNGGVRYSTREMFDEIRGELAAIRNEMRESRHTLAATLRGYELRIISLESFQKDAMRKFDEHDRLAETHLPRLEQVLANQTLAETMKKAGWTKRERMLAYGLFAFAFIGAVGTIISILVLLSSGGSA